MLNNLDFKLLKTTFCILCFICTVGPSSALFSQNSNLKEKAHDAFSKRDYKSSLKLWKEVASYAASENNVNEEIDALLEIVRSGMHVSQFDTSAYYAKRAARLAKSNNLEKHYGRAMNTLSVVYEFLNEEDSVLYAANEVLKNTQLDHSYISDSYTSISNVYYNRGEIEKRVSYISKAIEIDRMHQDSSSLPFNLVDLANAYTKTSDYNTALELHFEALSYLRPKVDKFKFATIYTGISSIFRALNNLEKSEEYGLKALDECNKLNLVSTKVRAFNQLGATAQKRRNYSEAIFYYSKSDSIMSTRDSKKSEIVSVKIAIGESQLRLKNYENVTAILETVRPIISTLDNNIEMLNFYALEAMYAYETNRTNALPKLEKAIRYAKEFNNISVEKNISTILSDYFYKRKNFKKSIGYQTRANTLQDSIYKLEQSYLVHNLEAQFKKKEQDNQIKLLATENDLKSAQIRQQRVMIFGSLLAIVLFGILLSFIASLLAKVKSQKKVVENSLEEKNVLLKEIHHRVKNNLQVISSLLALQSKYINDDTALNALKQGQDRVHSMALIHQDLYQGKDMIGVSTVNYFEQLIDNLFYSYNINEEEVKLNLEVEDLTLDVDTMIPLGLVLNELVSNAFKHAFKEDIQNAEISIKLKELNDELFLEVKDNGKSISSTSDIDGKSFGFELIKAFSQKLKARLEMNVDEGLSIQLFITNYSKAA